MPGKKLSRLFGNHILSINNVKAENLVKIEPRNCDTVRNSNRWSIIIDRYFDNHRAPIETFIQI